MKHLLLALLLTGFGGGAFAQQPPVGQQRPAAIPAQDTSKEGSIGASDLKYRRGYVVAQPAYLYRTLHDAQQGRYAHRLRAGAYVYTDQYYSSHKPWLRVARNTYFTYLKDSIPHIDKKLYYLKAAALVKKKGTVISFDL